MDDNASISLNYLLEKIMNDPSTSTQAKGLMMTLHDDVLGLTHERDTSDAAIAYFTEQLNDALASAKHWASMFHEVVAERDAALARLATVATTLESRYDWSKMPLDDPLGVLLRQFDTDGVWIGEVEG